MKEALSRRLLVTPVFLALAILSTRLAVGQGPGDSSIHASGGVPAIPEDLEASIDRYRFLQHADLQDWLAGTGRILYLAASEGIQQAFVARRPGEPGGN